LSQRLPPAARFLPFRFVIHHSSFPSAPLSLARLLLSLCARNSQRPGLAARRAWLTGNAAIPAAVFAQLPGRHL
jgi:hypothetical protein